MTPELENWLNDASQGLEAIGAKTMTSATPLTTTETLTGIVTNPSYLYPLGASPNYSKSILTLIDYLIGKDFEVDVIIDELETIYHYGIYRTPLNGFTSLKVDRDNKTAVQVLTKNPFYKYFKRANKEDKENNTKENDKLNDSAPYTHAEPLYLVNDTDNYGVYGYAIDINGSKSLKDMFENVCSNSPVSSVVDVGNRKPIKLKDGVYYLIATELSYHKLNDGPLLPSSNFIRLLQSSEQIATVSTYLKIYTSYNPVTDRDFIASGTECRSVEELYRCLRDLNVTPTELINIKRKLTVADTNSELFTTTLCLKKQCLLESFKRYGFNLYAISANETKTPLFKIDRTYANVSHAQIKTIEVIIVPIARADTKVILTAKMLKDYPRLKALLFASKAEAVRNYHLYQDSHTIIKGTLDKNGKSIAAVSNEETHMYDILRNVTFTYAHGVEGRAKNYGEEIMLVFNLEVPCSIYERFDIDPELDTIIIKDLETFQFELYKQILGRIQRSNPDTKFYVLFGDEDKIKRFFEWAYPKDYPIQFTFKTAPTAHKDSIDPTLREILEYIDAKDAVVNRGEDRDVPELFRDKRKDGNARKIDTNEVLAFINSERDNNKQIKDKDLYQLVQDKFGISKSHYKRIKQTSSAIETLTFDIQNNGHPAFEN
jgi:hypothetical protein